MSKLLTFTGEQKLTTIKDTELIKEVQSKLGVTVDGFVGVETLQAFADFKKKNFLAYPDVLGAGTATLLDGYKSILIRKSDAEIVFGRQITNKQLLDLNNCLRLFGIDKPVLIRHFMAQIAHESGGLRWLMELASGSAYEYRYDLGNTQAGDGRKYKGAGVIQLTGKKNYTRFSNVMKDPKILSIGAQYVADNYPFTSAGFWWSDNNMNQRILKGASVELVSRWVNGKHPANGLEDRKMYFARASKVIL